MYGSNGVAGAGVVARSTTNAGADASRLDVYDGVRWVRPADRWSYPARLHLAVRRAFVVIQQVRCSWRCGVDVVDAVVLVQRLHARSTHDRQLRTRQSGHHHQHYKPVL